MYFHVVQMLHYETYQCQKCFTICRIHGRRGRCAASRAASVNAIYKFLLLCHTSRLWSGFSNTPSTSTPASENTIA